MTAKPVCPFCLWAACGLILLLVVPELLTLRTSAGPALVWLLAIPVASALLRRSFSANAG